MANGDVSFVCTSIDAYVAVSIALDYGERSCSVRVHFAFILLLYNEDFVTHLVGVWDVCLVLFVIVRDGLMVALHF